MLFIEWTCCILISTLWLRYIWPILDVDFPFNKVCFWWSNWQEVNISLGNGLAPNSRLPLNHWWASLLAYSFIIRSQWVNSLRPWPNRRHFADDTFKCIFENENEWISPRISLKFVPKVRINNIPALVPIMAWRRPGDKPLSEPMMVSLLTHVCVTRPQWVNSGKKGGFTSAVRSVNLLMYKFLIFTL